MRMSGVQDGDMQDENAGVSGWNVRVSGWNVRVARMGIRRFQDGVNALRRGILCSGQAAEVWKWSAEERTPQNRNVRTFCC